MNVLDENIPESKRVAVRQIGKEVGRKGMQDDEIIPLLHGLDQPTFFTLDGDFYDRCLCHAGYCLVHLDVDEGVAAEYARRLLRQRQLNTKAKRMGWVIRVAPTGLACWRLHQPQEIHLPW